MEHLSQALHSRVAEAYVRHGQMNSQNSLAKMDRDMYRPYSSRRVRHRPTHKTNDAHRCLIFYSRFSCVHRFHRRTCPLADTPLLSRTRPGATGPPSQFTHIWVNSQAGWPISIWMSRKNRKTRLFCRAQSLEYDCRQQTLLLCGGHSHVYIVFLSPSECRRYAS